MTKRIIARKRRRERALHKIAAEVDSGIDPQPYELPPEITEQVVMTPAEYAESLDRVVRGPLNEGRELGNLELSAEKARFAEIIRAEITPLIANGWKNEALFSHLYGDRKRLGLTYTRSTLETMIKPIAKAIRRKR